MTTREELEARLEPFWEEGWGGGLDVGDGWINLIDRLVTDLEAAGPMPKLNQIKEKFAGLRFYTTWVNEEQQRLINVAEEESYKTCEMCGAPGVERTIGYWYTTLCDTDLDARLKARENRWKEATPNV